MYISGHARRRLPFTTWSSTHLASHFIKLTTSCRTDITQVPLGAEAMSRPVPMGKDDQFWKPRIHG